MGGTVYVSHYIFRVALYFSCSYVNDKAGHISFLLVEDPSSLFSWIMFKHCGACADTVFQTGKTPWRLVATYFWICFMYVWCISWGSSGAWSIHMTLVKHSLLNQQWTEIEVFPTILTLCLKRFHFDYNQMKLVKNNCPIEIPRQLQRSVCFCPFHFIFESKYIEIHLCNKMIFSKNPSFALHRLMGSTFFILFF